MIDETLIFLKGQLNDYFNLVSGFTQPRPDEVDFIKGDQLDPLTFNLGGISVLLVNVEQENHFRPDDPYRQTAADGKPQQVQPEVRLNLYVLFVARYAAYQDALHNLSIVIQYFQGNRMFRHPDAHGLSDDIQQLGVEMMTLPFAEQNEIWNALRVTYHPSVLYRVRMIVFRTATPVLADVIQHEPEITINQRTTEEILAENRKRLR